MSREYSGRCFPSFALGLAAWEAGVTQAARQGDLEEKPN
jgi:hypothetical protein